MQNSDSGSGLLPFLAVVVLSLVFLSIYKRRENLRHNVRAMLRAAVAAGVAFWLAWAAGWNQGQILLATLGVAAIALLATPRRTWYTPANVRRRVIARWEADTGKKFNSRYWELDHIIQFSQGGSNTEDNLRVVDKARNRAKGRKAPRWDLLGRR